MPEAAATRVDAAVVGGGAVGLAVADALLRSDLSVVSVYPPSTDERPVTSRAAGAMLGAFGEVTCDEDDVTESSFGFRLTAQRRYRGWLPEVCERAQRSVHQAMGTFVVANNDGVSDRMNVHRMKTMADGAGEPAEYVEPQDVPGLRPNPTHTPGLCLYLSNEHAVDPDDLLDALAASASTFGRWSHLAEVVRSVDPDGGGWMVTTLGGDVIRAQHVVLCAGSRSFEVLTPELREAAGLPEMYFGKGVSCIVRGKPQISSTIRTPNRAFACGIHVVPRSAGLLYLGATNNLGVNHDDERGVQPGELHGLFDDVLHQISTELRESRIESIRVGFRPIVSHGRPVIGRTKLPGLSVGTGTYRDGVLMAPLVGAIVVGEITGGDGPINPFPATLDAVESDPATLVELGIRDIVKFLQEPRGTLPYERAEQLRKYVTTLFRMAVEDGGAHAALRAQIQQQLRDAPVNETMHRVFIDIVERADG